MNSLDNPDNVVSIDIVRIERNANKKCKCGNDRRFIIDTQNRAIHCRCGVQVDPFDALFEIARQYEHINDRHRALNEQRNEWLKQKPRSVVFKKLEQMERRGLMLPVCPNCEVPFEFGRITGWVNAEFFLKRQQMMKKELMD